MADVLENAINIAHRFSEEEKLCNPVILCEKLGIILITDKPLHKDGYFICYNSHKYIFISSNVKNRHRQGFVIAHEIGHFLMHQNCMYGCTNVSLASSLRMNTPIQEKEANDFATELLLPKEELATLIPNRSLTFSDIFAIASYFDVSVTHAAIKAIRLSNTEDEVLLCYNGQMLQWYVASNTYGLSRMIPAYCPVDLSKAAKSASVNGVWDALFEGSVSQEIFQPYGKQTLVLLSGTRNDYDEESYGLHRE